MSRPKALICFSGGIDSTVAAFLYDARGYSVTLAIFESNTPDPEDFLSDDVWLRTEQAGFPFDAIRLPFIPSEDLRALNPKRAKLAATNAIEADGNALFVGLKMLMAAELLSYGAAKGFDRIVFGHMPFNSQYADSHPSALRDLEHLWTRVYGDRVKVPLIEHPFFAPGLNTKAAVIKTGHELGVDFAQTYSCRRGSRSNGRVVHCGTCEACLERCVGFAEAGLDDPTCYLA